MQLPMVLALRPKVQRRSLRPMERLWLHRNAAPRHIEMSCNPLCNPDLPLGSIHLDPTAHPSPGQIIQEPSLLPLEVALVLPLSALADEC